MVEVAALAATQHGVIATRQLERLGVSSTSISRWRRRGMIHPVHRGVYAVGHPALSQEGRWMAAVLTAGPRAALSHLAAAALWGLIEHAPRQVEVTRPGHTGRRGTAVLIHHSRELGMAGGDVTVRAGIPVTTVPRLLVDLAPRLGSSQLAGLIREATYHDLLDAAAVRAEVAQARGRRGSARLKAALDGYLKGSSGSRSGLEERYVRAARRHGLPMPLVNHRVRVSGGSIEVDLVWPEQRLCVEVDGPAHARAATRREDALRDQLLAGAGHRVLRCGHRDVEAGIRRIARALGTVS